MEPGTLLEAASITVRAVVLVALLCVLRQAVMGLAARRDGRIPHRDDGSAATLRSAGGGLGRSRISPPYSSLIQDSRVAPVSRRASVWNVASTSRGFTP